MLFAGDLEQNEKYMTLARKVTHFHLFNRQTFVDACDMPGPMQGNCIQNEKRRLYLIKFSLVEQAEIRTHKERQRDVK